MDSFYNMDSFSNSLDGRVVPPALNQPAPPTKRLHMKPTHRKYHRRIKYISKPIEILKNTVAEEPVSLIRRVERCVGAS
jgi:hypothetical protein